GLWDFTTSLSHNTAKTLTNPAGPISLVGVLPTVCWNGGHKKPVPSRRNSRMVCRPSTVRIAPPNSSLTRSPIAAQITSSTLSSPSSNAPDPCAKEAVLSPQAEEEKDSGGRGRPNICWHPESSGSGHLAFKPVVANGVPAAFVPKPGPLKRGLNSQSSDGHLNKRSHTSSVSSSTSMYTCGISMCSCNAITSSYSSTGGLSQVPAPGGVEEVGSLHLLVDYAVFASCLLSGAEITSKLTAVTNP
ncbi:hypothetical protein MC885_019197, partial [Smutsia gigantea]